MKSLLLLPSAKLIPMELRPDFGDIASAMIPLGGRPALHYISERFKASDIESTLIAAHDGAELIREYLNSHPELNAQLVDVGNTATLGETIACALLSLVSMPDRLLINFADTYVGDTIVAPDTICYSELREAYRWTTFCADEDGWIVRVDDKNRQKLGKSVLPVFVGVFSISQPSRFLQELLNAIQAPPLALDPFYSAIVKYFNDLDEEHRSLQLVRDWRDFGHLDTYYATQRTFFLREREFNQVAVDLSRGVVRKASCHSEKLSREIEWYLSLPPKLQYLAPRVFDYQTGQKDAFIEMEFYGYPALNDVYLYGDWDLGVWNQVLLAIGSALDGMQAYKLPALDAAVRSRAMRKMYEDKTAERLQPIVNDRRFNCFCKPSVLINGKECMGLRGCLEALPRVFGDLNLYASASEFTVVHGDLCLSNILYDRRNSFVRIIDPRGSFGDVKLYGDLRYDLAKLCHSFEGDYDFFVNGLFHLECGAGEVNYYIQDSPRHLPTKRLFHEWILSRCQGAYEQIKLIESLLFLSMVPLHADRPESQKAFLARGIELFQAVVDGHITRMPPSRYAASN